MNQAQSSAQTPALMPTPRQPLPASPAQVPRSAALPRRPRGAVSQQAGLAVMGDLFGTVPNSEIDLNTGGEIDDDIGPAIGPAIGRAIGRDFARYGQVPPAQHLQADSPVYRGWLDARALFRGRALTPRPAVSAWLALRLSAWQLGQAVEDVQLTPDFLRRITVARCPVTREVLQALDAPARSPAARGSAQALPAANESPAAVVRLHTGAAWSAGHLAVVSAAAAAERGNSELDALLQRAQAAEDSAPAETPACPALDAASALRLAVLVSFVTPLPHAQALALPMAVLPPPRVRLLNAAQALQALLSLQFTAPGWSHRLSRIEALVPGTALRRDFNLFAHALIPRVLEAGPHAEATHVRHALEDAWTQPLVQRRWQRFALALGEAGTQALVQRITARKLVPAAVQVSSTQQATEGWALMDTPCETGTAEAPGVPLPALQHVA